MKIHHTGCLVKNMAKAKKAYLLLGFLPEGEEFLDPSRKITIQFMRNGATLIELVHPESEDGAAGSLLKRTGSSPYHFCYESEHPAEDAALLEQSGFVRITDWEPAPAIGGRRVAFFLNPASGIAELIEN